MVRTTDGGNTWDTLLNLTTFYQADFFDFNNGFAVSPFGFVIKTTDGGMNWDTVQNLPSNNTFYDVHMTDPLSAIVSADNGLIYSLNQSGYTVDTLYDMLAGGAPLIIKDFDFETSTSGFGGGYANGYSGIARTTDGGATWDVRATNGFLNMLFDEISLIDSQQVWGIENSPAIWEHISFSIDGGYYWNSGFLWFSLSKLVSVDFISTGFGIVAENLRLFYTIDSGANWSLLLDLQTGFSGFSKINIVNDSIVYVGGRDGVYKIMYPLTVGLADNSNESNIKFSVFPNPVSNILNVFCDDITKENFSVVIHDINGRKIFNEIVSNKNFTIDLKNLAPGIYNMSLICGSNLYTQKFIKL